MAYTKLHATILDSSVWLEPAHVRLVWITMLAMADQHGVVHASVGGLAHRARVTKEECSDAIARFLGPDPDSRDRTTGERIEEVPGGWLVLNHANYRDRQTREQSLTAARVAKHRAKTKERSDDSVTPRYVTDGNDGKRLSAYASADGIGSGVEGEPERGVKSKMPPRPDDVPEDLWQEWVAFRKSKRATVTKLVLDTTRAKATEAGMTMVEALTFWIANGQTGFFPKPKTAKPGTRVGGFDRFGKWQGVGDNQNYSEPVTEDNDPFCEHPVNVLKRENGIRATKGLPPLSGVEEQKILNPGAF